MDATDLPAETACAGRCRVAVIDDEDDVLTFMRCLLEDQGYEVLTVARPAGAVAQLEAFAPHAICLDLLMPEQLGFSLFVELRHHPALGAVPILILSGLNARNELGEALRSAGSVAPPSAWVEKPIEPRVLFEELARALGHAGGGGS